MDSQHSTSEKQPHKLDASRQFLAAHFDKIAATVASCIAIAQCLFDWIDGSINLANLSGGSWYKIGGWLAVSIGLLLLLRMRSARGLLSRIILPPPRDQHIDALIFRGPLPYSSDDRGRLPCRGKETAELWNLIQQNDFVVVDGESGCGKSSLVAAAVLPLATQQYVVKSLRVADGDPTQLDEAVRQHGEVPTAEQRPLLLCLDQFEEIFVNIKDKQRSAFFAAVGQIVQSGVAKVVVVLRSDFLDLFLAACRQADPEQTTLDLSNYYTLTAFDVDQARAALSEMLAPVYEACNLAGRKNLDDLSEQLVLDLLRPPRDARLSRDDQATVLPVELQIVGMMIERVGLGRMTASQFSRLGGKGGLTKQYIEEVKQRILRRTGIGEPTVSNILCRLISSAGTKHAVSADTIDQDLSLKPGMAMRVLDVCQTHYLVKQIAALPERGPGQRFELLHDHLVDLLDTVADTRLQKARSAQARLQFWFNRGREQGGQAIEAGAAGGTRPSSRRLLPLLLTPLTVAKRLITAVVSQRVPIGEILGLWPYATRPEFRQMLRKSLRGFAVRGLMVITPIAGVIGLGSWKIAEQRADNWKSRVTMDLQNLGFTIEDKHAACNAKMTQKDFDEGLRRLHHVDVESFSIHDCRTLTSLAGFSNVPQLTKLDLQGCDQLESLKGLEVLSQLEVLNLKHCTSVKSLQPVMGLQHLRDLDISACDSLVDDAGTLAPLRKLPSLETLTVDDCPHLHQVAGLDLPQLQTLSLRGCVNLVTIAEAKLPELAELDLTVCRSLESLAVFDECLQLKSLTLLGCRCISEVALLDQVQTLEALDIRGCRKVTRAQIENWRSKCEATQVDEMWDLIVEADQVVDANLVENSAFEDEFDTISKWEAEVGSHVSEVTQEPEDTHLVSAEPATHHHEPDESPDVYGQPLDPFTGNPFPAEMEHDPYEPFPGIIIGFDVIGTRYSNGEDKLLRTPGDDVTLSVNFRDGTSIVPVHNLHFTVVDIFESNLPDVNHVAYVDRDELLKRSAMVDPDTGQYAGTATILLRLKDPKKVTEATDRLKKAHEGLTLPGMGLVYFDSPRAWDEQFSLWANQDYWLDTPVRWKHQYRDAVGQISIQCPGDLTEDLSKMVEKVLGDDLAAMTWIFEQSAVMTFGVRGIDAVRAVTLRGIDPKTYGKVCSLRHHLQHPNKRKAVNFSLEQSGYDEWVYRSARGAIQRKNMFQAGFVARNARVTWEQEMMKMEHQMFNAPHATPLAPPPQEEEDTTAEAWPEAPATPTESPDAPVAPEPMEVPWAAEAEPDPLRQLINPLR